MKIIFHNIFSRKKQAKKELREIEKPKIIADLHEKNSLVISNLHELNCNIEIRPLKVGDYLIGGTVIERKTFSDLISSMLNKRLIQQLRNLKQYSRALLLIENYNPNSIEYPENNGLNPNALRGLILSISLNHKIPIIFSEDAHETALYLALLAKQQQKSRQEISLHSRIPKTLVEQKKYILEAFPNIGPKTAGKLLKEFKTLSNIFNSDEENIKKILKGRAKRFRRLLGE